MKNFFLASLLLLAGCSCICPAEPVRVISNEKGTDIYYNEEYLGSDSTYALLRNKNVRESTLSGEKKGCTTQTLPVEYGFDLSVLNVFDLRNVIRLLTWDVYIVDDSKNMYNVTPKCK